MTELTDEQKLAADKITGLVGTDEVITLTAPAGCGKSFCVAQAGKDIRVLYLTPTHAAKDVLLAELPTDSEFEVATVHKAVGWGMRENAFGKEEWTTGPLKTKQGKLWTECDVVVIDEASMISKMLFNGINKYLKHFNKPAVWVGDASQLSSPASTGFSVFNEPYPIYRLSKSMRFKENSGIDLVCSTLRRRIESSNTTTFRIPDKNLDDVRFLEDDKWVAELKEAHDSGEDFLCVAADHKYLRTIREMLTGETHKFSIGQKIRCTKSSSKFKNSEVYEVVKADEPFSEVVMINWKQLYSARPAWLSKEEWKSGELRLNYQEIVVDNGKKALVEADYLTVQKLKNTTKKYGMSANKPKFRKLEEFQVDFLATVHSCQGRSVDKVFIPTNNVLVKTGLYVQRGMGKEHLRLCYVACSRARKELIFTTYE